MRVLSDEWVKAAIESLKNDADYQKKAKGFDSTLQFVVTDVPGEASEKVFGAKAPQIDEVWIGQRREGCDYTINVTYPILKDLLAGNLSATMALMQKKIKIEGNMSKVMKYVGAVNRMIDLMKTVPSEWPA